MLAQNISKRQLGFDKVFIKRFGKRLDELLDDKFDERFHERFVERLGQRMGRKFSITLGDDSLAASSPDDGPCVLYKC